jgi:hypothetical protein
MSEIRRRIEALEHGLPREIVLTLADGSTFHHSGPPLKFASEAVAQAESGGPIVDACCRTVKAMGCGRLYELIAAIAEPLIAEKKRGKHVERRGSRSANRRHKTNVPRTARNGRKR